MKKLAVIAVSLVILVMVGGGIFLATSKIPAPSARIEKPISDDKMPK